MEMVKQGWGHLEEGPCKKLKGWSSWGNVIACPSLCGHSGRSVETGGDMETHGSYHHIQERGDGVWTRVVTLVTKGQGKTQMIGRKRELQYLC